MRFNGNHAIPVPVGDCPASCRMPTPDDNLCGQVAESVADARVCALAEGRQPRNQRRDTKKATFEGGLVVILVGGAGFEHATLAV